MSHRQDQARSPEALGTRTSFCFPSTLAALGSLVHCFLFSAHSHPVHAVPFQTAALIQASLCGQCARSDPGIKCRHLCPLCQAFRDRANPAWFYRCDREGAESSQTGGVFLSANEEGPASGSRSGVLASAHAAAG